MVARRAHSTKARSAPGKVAMKCRPSQSVAMWGDWPIAQHDPPLLFNVEHDPSEQRNVAGDHPEIVDRALTLVKEHQQKLVPGQPQR